MYLWNNHKLFFGVDDKGAGGAIENKGLDKGGMLEFLQEEDEEEKPLKLDEKKDEKEKDDEGDKKEKEKDDDDKADSDEDAEDDELAEIEKELDKENEEDDDKDDDLELIAPARRKDILKAFPDLFKKFPFLETAMYKAQKFYEVFPSIKDAKNAHEKAGVLDRFEADLSKGNLEPALKAAKANGDAAFNSLVDSYLPNLYTVDKDAYHHVVGNIVKMTVNGMIRAAGDKNPELKEAAAILNKFVFQTDEVTPPSKLSREDANKPQIDEAEKLKVAHLREKFDDAREVLTTKVKNTLTSTIEANIDPRESMTAYVRKNATREAYEKLESLLDGDKRLGLLIDRLWESSFKNNLSKESVDKIKTAYLSRARTLLPTVIKQARNEALKGMGKRVREESNEEEGNEEEKGQRKKGPLPVGRSASSSNGGSKSDKDRAKEIPANVSTRDFLMQD